MNHTFPVTFTVYWAWRTLKSVYIYAHNISTSSFFNFALNSLSYSFCFASLYIWWTKRFSVHTYSCERGHMMKKSRTRLPLFISLLPGVVVVVVVSVVISFHRFFFAVAICMCLCLCLCLCIHILLWDFESEQNEAHTHDPTRGA